MDTKTIATFHPRPRFPGNDSAFIIVMVDEEYRKKLLRAKIRVWYLGL